MRRQSQTSDLRGREDDKGKDDPKIISLCNEIITSKSNSDHNNRNGADGTDATSISPVLKLPSLTSDTSSAPLKAAHVTVKVNDE